MCVCPALRERLKAGEVQAKEEERERRQLEETVDMLRKELNKTEQARKDANIRVSGDAGSKGKRKRDCIRFTILRWSRFIQSASQ